MYGYYELNQSFKNVVQKIKIYMYIKMFWRKMSPDIWWNHVEALSNPFSPAVKVSAWVAKSIEYDCVKTSQHFIVLLVIGVSLALCLQSVAR